MCEPFTTSPLTQSRGENYYTYRRTHTPTNVGSPSGPKRRTHKTLGGGEDTVHRVRERSGGTCREKASEKSRKPMSKTTAAAQYQYYRYYRYYQYYQYYQYLI